MSSSKPSLGFSARRREIVEAAFARFDPQGTGFAPYDALVAAYDVAKHPTVALGDMAPSAARQILANQIKPSADANNGNVAFEDFVMFHQKMSNEVDKLREKDLDYYYVTLVSNLWNVNTLRIPPTNIIPVTFQLPTGLLATRNLDLIWVDESSGKLVGYRGVVKPCFARKVLPESLQGHVAFVDELRGTSVTYLPPQPAVQPPYDLVWGQDEKLFGLEGLILSNVDLSQLPAALTAHVIPSKDAKGLAVQYVNESTFENPTYKTSNSKFGYNAEEYTRRLNEEKLKTLTGQNPVGVEAGRSGAFTAMFGGGMPQAAGLNFTLTRSRVLSKEY